MIGEDAQELAIQFDCSPRPSGETVTKSELAPAVHPIEFLLGERGGQKNPVINRFIHKRLSVFGDALKNSHQQVVGMTRYGAKVGHVPVSSLDLICRELNRIFYEVMVEKNPRKIIPIEIFFPFVQYSSSQLFPYLSSILLEKETESASILGELRLEIYRELSPDDYDLEYVYHFAEEEAEQQNKAKEQYTAIAREAFKQLWVSTTEVGRKKQLQQISSAFNQIYVTNGVLLYNQAGEKVLLASIKELKKILRDAEAQDNKYWKEEFKSRTSSWEYEHEGWLERSRNIRDYKEDHLKSYRKAVKTNEDIRAGFNRTAQERQDKLVSPLKQAVTAELAALETSLLELQEFMQALADDPIMGTSRLVEIPIELSSPEVAARIANQLINPEKVYGRPYIARCKLAHGGEHTIQALQSEQADASYMVADRLVRIVQHTRATYCKKRADVEDEIAARQKELMKPPDKKPPRSRQDEDEE